MNVVLLVKWLRGYNDVSSAVEMQDVEDGNSNWFADERVITVIAWRTQ
jgi:hypothetical protein